jgi:hypothetical protein
MLYVPLAGMPEPGAFHAVASMHTIALLLALNIGTFRTQASFRAQAHQGHALSSPPTVYSYPYPIAGRRRWARST